MPCFCAGVRSNKIFVLCFKMCGIMCEIRYSGSKNSILRDQKVLQRITNRGPDCSHIVEINVCDGITVTLFGAVLWMRGPEAASQPVENGHGILLYNGDIFNKTWDTTARSDTNLIMEKLSQTIIAPDPQKAILQQLAQLKGPFSIIYFDKASQNLYFMRDRIGRTTLLFHKNEDSIVISSVLGRKYKCIEVPATNIHVLDLTTNKIRLHPWEGDREADMLAVEDWLKVVQKQQSIPDEEFTSSFDDSKRDLIEDDVVRYIQNSAQDSKCKLTLMEKLLEHAAIKETVLNLTNLLEKSIEIRLKAQPNKCSLCIRTLSSCNHCTVGILFSGGLDCTVLAYLADKYLPKEQSIDLFNVAFKKDNASYNVPDRLTGRHSFEELKKLCQGRKWLFKEVDIPKTELADLQGTTIADLVYPRQTILDESLGTALWFAARAQDHNSESSCRVLLLGSGADELFGGYTRHRNAFKRHGWSGLDKELLLDWRRISFRNLARDNRVIFDHGRQPRMPYLDEDFVDFVLKLKPWLKCFPCDSLPQGVGDKLMLRLVAFNLGLREVVTFPKRALQFGSRIANKKEKGSDLSKTLLEIKD